MADINVNTNFTLTYKNTTVSGFYKDILIKLENILKNYNYDLKYYFTTYYEQENDNSIVRSTDKTLCSKNFLTLANNAYSDSLLGFTKVASTIKSNAEDFSIEIKKGVQI